MANQISSSSLLFKIKVAQCIVNFVMAEERVERHHQPNFMQRETKILVRDVQARNHQIYGTMIKPSWAEDDVKGLRRGN